MLVYYAYYVHYFTHKNTASRIEMVVWLGGEGVGREILVSKFQSRNTIPGNRYTQSVLVKDQVVQAIFGPLCQNIQFSLYMAMAAVRMMKKTTTKNLKNKYWKDWRKKKKCTTASCLASWTSLIQRFIRRRSLSFACRLRKVRIRFYWKIYWNWAALFENSLKRLRWHPTIEYRIQGKYIIRLPISYPLPLDAEQKRYEATQLGVSFFYFFP